MDDGTTEVPALPRSAATGGDFCGLPVEGLKGQGRVGCTPFTYVLYYPCYEYCVQPTVGILGDEKTRKYQLYRAIL